MTIEILYEDPDVLVVSKPAGLTVIPARDGQPDCLRLRLEVQQKEKLWVVHRLDRDTSGIVLFARSAKAHRTLSMAWESHRVYKQYVCFTLGTSTETEGVIEVALHSARKGKMRPATSNTEEGAQPSKTFYRIVASKHSSIGCVNQLQVKPETGRQHQIRVHLRWKEIPLLVDPLYSTRSALSVNELSEGSPAIERLTLHAEKLEWESTFKKTISIVCSLPQDLLLLKQWIHLP